VKYLLGTHLLLWASTNNVKLPSGSAEIIAESRHVFALKKLPRVHTDPFDRLLVAQAITEGMFFLTADRKLNDYGERVILVR
jgi:PIN domain nuclease of toxin-antitoxin system